IMFIPAAVGLLTSLDALKSAWLPILISIVIVTPIVFFCSGKLTDVIIGKSQEKGGSKNA
nr:CidA/LrgA family protein [Clostridia bacterium]